jgi:acetoin utilization protein AcuB
MEISEITVEEYTSQAPITIEAGADLDRAIELMQEHGIRHLPVISKEQILGIVSERDVLTHVGKDWGRLLKVGDIMSTSVLSVYVNDGLGDVAYQLSAEKKGSAIVLDTDGSLYGIFTTTDALNALVEIFYPIGSRRKNQSSVSL